MEGGGSLYLVLYGTCRHIVTNRTALVDLSLVYTRVGLKAMSGLVSHSNGSVFRLHTSCTVKPTLAVVT